MKKKLKLKSLHFAVGALVIGAFLPIFIKNDYYMMVLNRVLINIIVVLGLNFITGLTGQMNLGTAGIFALGAYSSALFTRYTNLTPWRADCGSYHGNPYRQGTGISQPESQGGISVPDHHWIRGGGAPADFQYAEIHGRHPGHPQYTAL